jgi:DeoR/GlpR family transcriptional regulator of sugar metabolism
MSVPGVELVVLGGYLYPRTGVVLGPLTVEALKSLKVRRLIIGVGGITEEGLFNQNSLLVETQKQMLDAADEVILATDSSKFGHSELVPLCPLNRVHKLVVDSGLSDHWRQVVRKNGIELVIAE